MTWKQAVESRRAEVLHPIATRLLECVLSKQSAVMLSGDVASTKNLIDLIELVHPWIAAVKTHVDCVDDADVGWKEVISCCQEKGLPIMEDRKFADIGGIAHQQMLKGWNIAGWADAVTAHGISGPDIIDGLQDAWKIAEREGGVVLLAQMSSRGNLVESLLTEHIVKMGTPHKGVIGYIGNGSDPMAITRLRGMIGSEQLILTPGIHPDRGKGGRGQRYGAPDSAVEAGADLVIIGSAIHRASDPVEMAKRCADATRKGLASRASR
ncbi:MAG TPA: orotidine-5'-phosphate decarboxylase [Candidatus Poseidoniales archaeon]|nr:orotidine-5'-phosphate decarboxylase [Candidatus Poseidoniales archaeon]